MWAVITLISLFVLLLIVLSVPVDVVLSLNTRRNKWFKIYLKWWFGLVRINLRKDKGKPVVEQQAPKGKKESANTFNYDTIIHIIRIRDIFRQVYHLLRDLIYSFKIKIFELDLKIGLEDPVDNGYLFACIIPFSSLLSSKYNNVNIQTVFENELIFDCNTVVRIRTFPFLILGSVLGFLFSRPVLEVISILGDARWRGKRY